MSSFQTGCQLSHARPSSSRAASKAWSQLCQATSGDGSQVSTGLGHVPSTMTGNVQVAIRPEHMLAGGDVSLGHATVEEVAFFGTFCRVRLNTDAGTLFAHVSPAEAPETGTKVPLAAQTHQIKVFPS